MPDLSGIPAVDVALGLAFMFFLLSIVCSSVNEGISAVFGLRANTLKHGIASLLGNSDRAKAFYEHWRVDALIKPATGPLSRLKHSAVGPRKPSYMPSRVFANTLLDLNVIEPTKASAAALDRQLDQHKDEIKALPAELKTLLEEAQKMVDTTLSDQGRAVSDDELVARAKQALGQGNVPQPIRGILEDALASVDAGDRDVTRFRKSIEHSFDEVMDRASGWYKRRAQLFLFVIAVILAAAINADSFNIGRQLWRDDALRASVVAQANKAGLANATKCPKPSSSGTDNRTPVEIAADCLDKVKQLDLPLGWKGVPRWEHIPVPPWGQIPGKLLGLLVTAFALTLGAPFWFDLLGKVAQLRGSGPPAAGSVSKAAQTRKAELSVTRE